VTGLGTADVEEADENWVVEGADECGAAGGVEEDGCLSCTHNTVSMQTHQETRSERRNRMAVEGKEKKAAKEGDRESYRCVARKRLEQRHGVLSPNCLERSARIEQSPSAKETEDRSRGAAQKSLLPSPAPLLEEQMGKIRSTEKSQPLELPVVVLRYLLLTQHLQIIRSGEPQLYHASKERHFKDKSLINWIANTETRVTDVGDPWAEKLSDDV